MFAYIPISVTSKTPW